jgi:hypothetical protein
LTTITANGYEFVQPSTIKLAMPSHDGQDLNFSKPNRAGNTY